MAVTDEDVAQARQDAKNKRNQERMEKEVLGKPVTAPPPPPPVKKAKGGSVSSASARADGCAQRGKTRGKMV